MKGKLLLLILLVMASPASTQDSIYKFWIQFKDKNGTPYTLDNPGAFLTERALQRRTNAGFSVSEEDLPVSPVYTDSLSTLGYELLYTSRWMNAAVIRTSDSAGAVSLTGKEFVTGVECLYRPVPFRKSAADKWNETFSSASLASDHQLKMLRGDLLHDADFQGQGMIIAVLDAGFPRVNEHPAFDALRLENRLLGTRNFVHPGEDFFGYQNGTHGSHVLSTMAGILPGQYQGTAPEAGYWLIQTEETASEFRIEEANWLAGAELADSIGADIINSSLGYSNGFSVPEQDYRYEDMDGQTTLVSRAAAMATARGILVVTSAGNSGRTNNPWGYISAPADGDAMLAVGSVNALRMRSDFSSRGPSADGRVKPDVMTMGEQTAVVWHTGEVVYGNGTSYASPLMAGLAACLWQKNRDWNNREVRQHIIDISSQVNRPDTLMGYGLPDFSKLEYRLQDERIPLTLFPNPVFHTLYISYESGGRYRMVDLSGRVVMQDELPVGPSTITLSLNTLESGTYFMLLEEDGLLNVQKFIKIK